MKNQFLALLMLTALAFGCKPRTQELRPQLTTIDSDLIEKAKTYFENEQNIALTKTVEASIGARDNQLNFWTYPIFRTFKPIWSKTEQVTLLNGNKVLITPLRRNMNVNYNNLFYIRRLRIELDAQNQVVKANIIELVTLKKSVADLKKQIIANVFEEIHARTDAKIMVFDAGYTPLMQNSSVWKGEATNNNSNARGSSVGSDASPPPPSCYYLTVVVSCSDVQYLADITTDCDPGDSAGTVYGIGNVINNCPGGGGGGGSPWTPPSDPNDPPGGGGGQTGGNDDIGQDEPFDPNYLPPTFDDPNGYYKTYKTMLNQMITDTQTNLNTPPYGLEWTETQKNNLRRKLDELKKAKNEIKTIEKSKLRYYFASGGHPRRGAIKYDAATQRVLVLFPTLALLQNAYSNLGLKAHEMKHVYQLETGKLSLDKITGEAGVLYDLYDEVEATDRQYIIDAGLNYGQVDINMNRVPNYYQINTTTLLQLGLDAAADNDGQPLYQDLPRSQITINTNPQGTNLQNATNPTDIFVKP